MATIQKKCPAEAGQYFQAECYDLRFHGVGCLWFFWIRLDFGFSFGFGLGLDLVFGFSFGLDFSVF
jgi:hypothetical protein